MADNCLAHQPQHDHSLEDMPQEVPVRERTGNYRAAVHCRAWIAEDSRVGPSGLADNSSLRLSNVPVRVGGMDVSKVVADMFRCCPWVSSCPEKFGRCFRAEGSRSWSLVTSRNYQHEDPSLFLRTHRDQGPG